MILISVIIADQASKAHVSEKLLIWSHPSDTHLYQGSRLFVGRIGENQLNREYIDFIAININYVRNHGAAWGAFNRLPNSFRVPLFSLATAAAVIIIFRLMYINSREKFAFHWGLTLLCAGALGNLVDRVARGYVIDWLDVRWSVMGWRYNFPNFNIADIAITIGFIVLFTDSIRLNRSTSQLT